MVNILVTGVAGFIGSHVAEKLLSVGYHVIGLDNFDPFYPRYIKENNLKSLSKSLNFSFDEGDICDKDFLSNLFGKYKIDIVIHLAAKAGVRPSVMNPSEFCEVNVLGTLNLLETMNQCGVKQLLFSSSSSVYGNNEKIPYSEMDSVDHPISPYAATKKAGELLTYTFHHLYQFSVINLRFFTVYGPRQRPDLAIHKFFSNLYSEKPIEIFGDGNTERDYTYIDDTVSGILASLDYIQEKNLVYETINLGNSSPIKLVDLIKQIEKVTDKKFIKISMPMQEGDVQCTYADISKAKELLQYNHQVKMEHGLLNFKNWFENK
jgi:nucleoside-diphosphate-sugar epimerase